MKLKFTAEQEKWQQEMREMAETYLAPRAIEADKNKKYPDESRKMLGERGIMGMAIDRKYGGSQADLVSYAVAIEECAKACAVTGGMIQTHNALGAWPIQEFGTEEQKNKYLPRLASGEWLGAFCLTEANAGSDAAGQQTQAVETEDGWILNGSKMFITGGSVADLYTILAMTDKSKGVKGISAFLVEKGTPGLSFGKLEEKMGLNASATAEVVLENVKLPPDALLGEKGKGFKIAMTGLDFGRVGVAAQSIGIAQGAFDETVKYLKSRPGFRPDSDSWQATAFEMSDMKTRIEAGRMLLYRSAYLKEIGDPEFSMAAAQAKLHCSETAMYVTTKAVQFHGWEGYTSRYVVERMMRDAKIMEIFEGTSEIQKLVIAGKIFA